MKKAVCEEKFEQDLWGLKVLGYIDINSFDIGDLKTTHHSSLKQFISSMDFLQAALYLTVTRKENFYYIGVSKQKPHNLLIFNVKDYPAKLAKAMADLNRLIRYVRGKIYEQG
jgi:hypothetical protein